MWKWKKYVFVEISQLGTKASDCLCCQNNWHNFLSLQFLCHSNSNNYKNYLRINDYLMYLRFSCWGNPPTLLIEGASVPELITSVTTFIKYLETTDRRKDFLDHGLRGTVHLRGNNNGRSSLHFWAKGVWGPEDITARVRPQTQETGSGARLYATSAPCLQAGSNGPRFHSLTKGHCQVESRVPSIGLWRRRHNLTLRGRDGRKEENMVCEKVWEITKSRQSLPHSSSEESTVLL